MSEDKFSTALQRTNTENWKQIFPEEELLGHISTNLHIVCQRFIYSHDLSAYSATRNMWTDLGNI